MLPIMLCHARLVPACRLRAICKTEGLADLLCFSLSIVISTELLGSMGIEAYEQLINASQLLAGMQRTRIHDAGRHFL